MIQAIFAKSTPKLPERYDIVLHATGKAHVGPKTEEEVKQFHRHQITSETVVVLRGRVVEEFYDEQERVCSTTYEISPSGPICALNIPAGTWHTLRSLESGTVILEIKDGEYAPIKEEDILKL